MDPALVPWLSVTALRVPRTWEGPPLSPFSAHPSPANDSSALSECSSGMRNRGAHNLAFESFL